MFFKTPVHLGELGIGMEESGSMIHSDTLYSAIHQSWIHCRQEALPGPLPLLISSAYPFFDEKFFFPKPGLPAPGFDEPDVREEYGKMVKKTTFLPLDLYTSWIDGQPIDYERLTAESNGLAKNMSKSVRPRVNLDRINNASGLYFVGHVSFKTGRSGLFFLCECFDELFEKLQGVIRFLGEEGIGGERSCGYGQFEPEFIDRFDIPESEQGEHYTNLSLYYPASQAELAGSVYSYQLAQRGGWTLDKTNIRHKQVLMFQEGSIFNRKVGGAVVDVAPAAFGHPIYRYGKAFLLRVR
jgi:CRISPR-associated protein Csm4